MPEANGLRSGARLVRCGRQTTPARVGTPLLQTYHLSIVSGFRSSGWAASWQEITVEPSTCGLAVAAHPLDPETAWFVPAVADEKRVPVDGKVVVARTTDGGKTFTVIRNGLPQIHAYDLTFRHALDVDARGERLAIGSTTGSLWTSDNAGSSWHTVTSNLPPIYCVRFSIA